MSATERRPRALVVTYHFPPDANIGTMRTLRVVRQLAQQGLDVTVLTSHPQTYRPGTPVDDSLLLRVPSSVRVVRARSYRGFETLKSLARRGTAVPGTGQVPGTTGLRLPAVSSSAPAARRSPLLQVLDVIDAALAIPDQEAAWLLPAITRGVTTCARWRPDVIYSSAPAWTGQLVAGALAAALRCPWVADFRDPWGRAPWRGDRFRFAVAAARGLEHLVVRRADKIVFVSQGNRTEFADHYGPQVASKFEVVPNGCDISEFDDVPRPPVETDRFTLLHAGSLYAGRTPVPLLRAIHAAIHQGIVDPERFRLRFLGANALGMSELTTLCQDLGLSRLVEFAPRVSRAESLQAMMSASSLLLLQPGHSVAVPAKVYEYLAAGRPILAIAEGETADIVEASGVGIVAASTDEAGIVRALEALLRRARGPVTAAPRDLFDGNARAAEIAAIIGATMGPGDVSERHASRHTGVPTLSEPATKTLARSEPCK
jgi:glycosyltransferase involved in cell wall biosynthesis